jgi:CheY-like chemotaxis protein
MKVLIADDNKTNLDILTHMLQAAGMHVTGCTGGREALDEVKRAFEVDQPFDICVLDVNMPGIGGDEVARQIRTSMSNSVPLLACASSIDETADKAYANGFNGYLPKPIKRIRLYKMLERLLGVAVGKKEAGAERPKIITQHSILEDAKHSASILLAEDNPVNQKLGVTVLGKAGYSVDVANNGQEAVDKIVADPSRYDIVLMDIQMPELNGLDATQELRKKGFTKIPIIAVTANAMVGDREKCLKAGMNDYIAKPIKREVVLAMLKKWVFERI